MIGIVGLDDHFPGPFSSSCAPRNLGEKLKGSFCSAKVSHPKSLLGS
jgi:hypothetical protein